MDSERILKEKIKNIDLKIDNLKKERAELGKQLSNINAEKRKISNYINRCAIFDGTIILFIAKLLSEKNHEPFRVFEYKKYKELCVYPRLLDESIHIGIASEDNIRYFVNNGNYNVDKFFRNDLGYEICEKNGRVIEPNIDCYDRITGYYTFNNHEEFQTPITFSFLLNNYGIKNKYSVKTSRANFDEYPYVQDFITYLFNLQVKNGRTLTYEEISKAYDDYILPELVLEKTKSK